MLEIESGRIDAQKLRDDEDESEQGYDECDNGSHEHPQNKLFDKVNCFHQRINFLFKGFYLCTKLCDWVHRMIMYVCLLVYGLERKKSL